MTKIVASGKTIEDAVRKGLTELQVAADRVRRYGDRTAFERVVRVNRYEGS